MRRILKTIVLDTVNLVAHFGGELSKPENVYTTKALKIPDYSRLGWQRESLGNGWYGNTKERVIIIINNCYLILDKDDKPLGVVYYNSDINKQWVYSISKSDKTINEFIKTIK